MQGGKSEHQACDSQESGFRSRTQNQVDNVRTRDDTGPIGQAEAGVTGARRASVEGKTRHQEAKKVSCDLVRQVV